MQHFSYNFTDLTTFDFPFEVTFARLKRRAAA